MNYRYRVKGVAEKAFILRGMNFRIGGDINTIIMETELAFVKTHCRLETIDDLQKLATTSQPIPTNSNTKKPRGVKHELPKSAASGANKGSNKAQI